MGVEGEVVENLEEGGMTAVLDFDMLCATVALQTQGLSAEKWRKISEFGAQYVGEDEEHTETTMLSSQFGGVQRMWEGGVMDCLEDRGIAVEAACCPWYRFGKNMRRAKLGPCFLHAMMYLFFVVAILASVIAFGGTRNHLYLYSGVVFTILLGIYLGYFRSRIRKQFNIKGGDSFIDGCVYHLLCSCCTLSQESRTLEMNNVQDGVWHGRGDTVCVGSATGGFEAFPLLPPSSTRSPRAPHSMERGDPNRHGGSYPRYPESDLGQLSEPPGPHL